MASDAGGIYLYGVGTGTVSAPARPASAQTRLAPPSPNPAGARVRLGFELAHATRIRLEILDLAGRRVATVLDGVLPAGHGERLWWPAAAGVRPGLYWAALSADGRRLLERFVVLER